MSSSYFSNPECRTACTRAVLTVGVNAPLTYGKKNDGTNLLEYLKNEDGTGIVFLHLSE